MDLTWTADFEALARLGNFSRAAAARHVTQPAFSRRIRALEDWAGAPLFRRDGQPVTLTEAGARLRPLLADVAQRLDAAREEVRSLGQTGDALRFAATHALSFSFFPAWLNGLPGPAPAGAIQLISDSLAGCEAAMGERRAQFLLHHGHDAAPSRLAPGAFVARVVGHDRLRLLASPGDPATRRLAYSAESGLGRIVAAVRPAPDLRPAFTSHLAAVLRSVARDGGGAAWLPESLVAADLADGTLAPVPGQDPIPVEIRMVRPAAPLGRAAEAFWSRLDAP